MATTIELKNSVTTGNSPSTLAQGEMGVNITDKKVWIGNASSTPIQLIGAGASMSLTSLTTSSDASISGLTVGKGSGNVSSNTAFGYNALATNSTGDSCVAVGYEALQNNTTYSNTGVGAYSLFANTSGTENTGLGRSSLQGNTTGASNVAVGVKALYSNTTAGSCVAVGYQAGYNSNAGGNTFVGESAGYGVTSGNYNTAIGRRVMYGGTVTGLYNTAVGGQDDGNISTMTSLTTGTRNTAVGNAALSSLTTGSNNTAVGYQAGAIYTTSSNNISLGYTATGSSATASNEIAIGSGAVGKGSNTGYVSVPFYQSNNSTLWSITSDQRLKKNVVSNSDGLNKITEIQVRNFEYRLPEEITEIPQNQAINKQGIQLGAIAQELALVLPECVEQQSTGIYTVNADPLIWYLVNAVKELKAEIDLLKGK